MSHDNNSFHMLSVLLLWEKEYQRKQWVSKERMNVAFIQRTRVRARMRPKKDKMLEVADYSRLIEEFFEKWEVGRGRKHWGTLREM